MRIQRTFIYMAYSDGLIKIGRTWNLKVRLGRLRSGRAEPVTLLDSFVVEEEDGRTPFVANTIEQRLHGLFRKPGQRGEWHAFRRSILKAFSAAKRAR